ncbi:MAG: hypothetical protein ACOX0P_01045 [Candidatus Dojkabacteria bacterium]
MDESTVFSLVVEKINNLATITPSDEPATICQDSRGYLNNVDYSEVSLALRKLEKDYEVIQITQLATCNPWDAYDEEKIDRFVIKILPSFKEFYEKFINKDTPSDKSAKESSKQDILSLEYVNRELKLNKLILLANPDFNTENDIVCKELFNNVGKTLTRKDLEEVLKQPLKKDLNKIAEQLGFKKDIRKIFLSVSKNNICLKKTSVSREDLNNFGIDYIRL